MIACHSLAHVHISQAFQQQIKGKARKKILSCPVLILKLLLIRNTAIFLIFAFALNSFPGSF